MAGLGEIYKGYIIVINKGKDIVVIQLVKTCQGYCLRINGYGCSGRRAAAVV